MATRFTDRRPATPWGASPTQMRAVTQAAAGQAHTRAAESEWVTFTRELPGMWGILSFPGASRFSWDFQFPPFNTKGVFSKEYLNWFCQTNQYNLEKIQ